MDIPHPPFPDYLWPTIPPTKSQRALNKGFSMEIPSGAAEPLLNSLARSIHLEMEGAGRWTAKTKAGIGMTEPPSSPTRARQCAQDAAQLLSIYTAAYNAAGSPGQDALLPDDLKAAATRSYQKGFLNEHKVLSSAATPFNDGLYSQLQEKPLSKGPKL